MKKISILIAICLLTNSVKSQNIDTVNVSLTLRAQDWAWAVGKYGDGSDSTSRATIRALRNTIIAANPANWNTNVTVNNVNGRVVLFIYQIFLSASFGEVLNMGNNTAERTTIYTNIRAINNPVLQYYIGLADGNAQQEYLRIRQRGKEILLDN